MRIERHPAVIGDDLPGIYAYVARDDAAAAERVLDAVAETFAKIAVQPECGIAYPSRNPEMKGARMLPVTGFNPNSEVDRGDLAQSAGRECHSSDLTVSFRYASVLLMSSRLSILHHLIPSNIGVRV